MCVVIHIPLVLMEVKVQLAGVGYLLLSCGSQVWNSSHQICQQIPFHLLSWLTDLPASLLKQCFFSISKHLAKEICNSRNKFFLSTTIL